MPFKYTFATCGLCSLPSSFRLSSHDAKTVRIVTTTKHAAKYSHPSIVLS
jgi:hypothetical protein